MSHPDFIAGYLETCAHKDERMFVAGSLQGVDQTVVIPALAEKEALFDTLGSLAENETSALSRTLVLCVINNRSAGIADPGDIENNQATMAILRRLIAGTFDASLFDNDGITGQCLKIRSSGLRLAFLDASSLGMAMPERGGGVGLARKLGLDLSLRIIDYTGRPPRLLFNLDADAQVQGNYLAAVRDYFEGARCHAGVVSYAHRLHDDPVLQAAICCYEIFLRFYVLGLRFAGSPYAFHTIGSTMVCTPESYCAVRGMNRREAAEDFYFLDKLAKLGPMAEIETTTVHPSSRTSRRVPFGTGQRMIRFVGGKQNEYILYDPSIFLILKRWLALMADEGQREADDLVGRARQIHPLLADFLALNRFHEIWPRIQRNHRRADALQRQFHIWFDSFKTMKLVHYLTEKALPKIDMFMALNVLMEMTGLRCPVDISAEMDQNINNQLKILNYLRNLRGT